MSTYERVDNECLALRLVALGGGVATVVTGLRATVNRVRVDLVGQIRVCQVVVCEGLGRNRGSTTTLGLATSNVSSNVCVGRAARVVCREGVGPRLDGGGEGEEGCGSGKGQHGSKECGRAKVKERRKWEEEKG